ncbi:Hypothetical Protein FCC1311_052862 [Hondaea fermentalgiana]|uniref:Steroid 5-alpha reductase C-terminal domain-containing protein n=1 Tax=Hondaea fermentalgiana TaxID=2315210 RepID=A0A2R5GMH2_9STRA|nr:Hypothetical Protein FCC1311_052862 [Hondaea fermentalgiana]|eukprot:GBG29064.1 Hypothetical Protein FCC1311_052862 [Hondaea fermentalgiana]
MTPFDEAFPGLAKYLGLSDTGADDGLRMCAFICMSTIAVCFVTAELTDNLSQTDKLWSIMPVVYAWVIEIYSNMSNARTLLMALLATIWGTRLTLNFTRHGGYSWPPWEGREDYRWVHVRKLLHQGQYPFLFVLFDLLFIAGYCHVILLGQAMPVFVVAKEGANVPLNRWDFAITLGVLALIAIESMADEQHQAFQNEKNKHERLRDSSKPPALRDGFFSSQLFSLCRHPNYAAEQAIWIVFYLFSVNVRVQNGEPLPQALIHWSMFGWVMLVSLFTPSALFSESLSAKKYENYKEYQRTTWMFFPFGTWGTWEGKTDFPAEYSP